MNNRQLLELVRTNLRYASPQTTDKLRKKGKSGTGLTRALLNQYLLSSLVFLFIYGATMFMIDFSKQPGFFTYYVALFSILAFSQGITVIYNVFFESQDLVAYLPLPFRQSTIYLSKIFVVTLTVTPYVFPMLVVFLMTGWRAGLALPLTLVLSLLLFLLVLGTIFTLCTLIVFGLTRSRFFKQHKKVVTSLLLSFSMLLSVGGILWMNLQSSAGSSPTMDRQPISALLPLFRISAAPFSAAGLRSLAGLMGLFLLLLGAVRFLILPRLYEQLTDVVTGTGQMRRKHRGNQTLGQLFVRYNMQLIKEPNLIMQVLSNSLLMPLVFILTFALGGTMDLSTLDQRFIGVVFFAGVALALMTVNQTSFVSNLISLDRENFNFLKTLPFSMKGYLKQKFHVGLAIQAALSVGIACIGGVAFKLPLPLILCLLLGSLVGCYLFCLRFFERDYRFLLLEWTSISQLFTRGSGTAGLLVSMLINIMGSLVFLSAYSVAAMYLPFWPLNLSIMGVFLVAAFLWIAHYKKSFWERFD